MKIILSIVIGIILCMGSLFLIPIWWIFAPIIFLITYFFHFKHSKTSFAIGFLIVFISWFILYIYKDNMNDSILSTKMATLFSLPNTVLLFLISSIVMGLIGGLSALSAHFLLKRKK